MQRLKRHNFVVFPYRPAERIDGEFNNGGIDLTSQPQRIAEIHEIYGYTWLKEFLIRVNAPEGLFMTFGCEIGVVEKMLCGYVDFSLRPTSNIYLRDHLCSFDDMFIAYLCHAIPDRELRSKSVPYAQQILEWKISPLEIQGHTYSKLNVTFHADQSEKVEWVMSHLAFFVTSYYPSHFLRPSS